MPSRARRRDGPPRVVPGIRELPVGALRPFGTKHIHKVTNNDLEPAVSLHVYAPDGKFVRNVPNAHHALTRGVPEHDLARAELGRGRSRGLQRRRSRPRIPGRDPSGRSCRHAKRPRGKRGREQESGQQTGAKHQ